MSLHFVILSQPCTSCFMKRHSKALTAVWNTAMLLPEGFFPPQMKICTYYLVTSQLPWSHCCHYTVCLIGLHLFVRYSTSCCQISPYESAFYWTSMILKGCFISCMLQSHIQQSCSRNTFPTVFHSESSQRYFTILHVYPFFLNNWQLCICAIFLPFQDRIGEHRGNTGHVFRDGCHVSVPSHGHGGRLGVCQLSQLQWDRSGEEHVIRRPNEAVPASRCVINLLPFAFSLEVSFFMSSDFAVYPS